MTTKQHSPRVRRVIVAAPLVWEFFLRLHQDHETNLPADSWPVALYADPERNAFQFIVQSESFEAIPEGAVIPELEVTVQR